MRIDSVSTIVTAAANQLGLATGTIADPLASTDQNILTLVYLLEDVCRELARAKDWTQLQKEHTFATANGTAAYALPSGFDRFQDQSAWNRTKQVPMAGGVTAQQWGLLKAVSGSGIVYKVLRIFQDAALGNAIQIHPTPTAIETIAFGYITRLFTSLNTAANPTSDVVSNSSDLIYFDSFLVIRALKLAFRGEKGFDTTRAQADYDAAWAMVAGSDGLAPVLSLTPRYTERLLDEQNLPETGFGV